MMLILYLCITILLLVLLIHTHVHYSKFGRIINKIPGLPPFPILGNIYQTSFSTDEIWSKVQYLYEKYYPTYVVWIFCKPLVFLRHPEDFKILLSCKNNINKCDEVYGSLKYSDIDGILSSGGQRWHHRRKILNNAFTKNHLEIYVEKINQRAYKFAEELRSRENIFVENISPMFLKLALASVCDAVMGIDNDTIPAEKEKNFRDAVDEFFEITLYRTLRPVIRDFMMPFLPAGWRLTRVNSIMHGFRNEIIQGRRKYHESMNNVFENATDDTEDKTITKSGVKGDREILSQVKDLTATLTLYHIYDTGLKGNLAVLDLLLLAEKKGFIDSHGVAEEILTIVGAGYETTGMAMSFLLTLLAENEEHQKLARAEILETMGEDNRITTEHMKKMTYLDRCIKESLRLFPTAPHIGRDITEDIRLNKYMIPAGAKACLSIYDLHRDHRFWPEPNKFDPDRFLTENVKQRHPFAYLPFSAGLRNCIGQKIAVAEIKLVAAYILYNFYLEPIDTIADLKSEMHFTIKCNSINMKFVRIHRD